MDEAHSAPPVDYAAIPSKAQREAGISRTLLWTVLRVAALAICPPDHDVRYKRDPAYWCIS